MSPSSQPSHPDQVSTAPSAPKPRSVRPLAPSPLDGRCGPPPGPTAALVELVYELLDAHADTAELASGLAHDGEWLSHLDYLRALQREGRRVLAQMAGADSA
jgi:hypothetical protein